MKNNNFTMARQRINTKSVRTGIIIRGCIRSVETPNPANISIMNGCSK